MSKMWQVRFDYENLLTADPSKAVELYGKGFAGAVKYSLEVSVGVEVFMEGDYLDFFFCDFGAIASSENVKKLEEIGIPFERFPIVSANKFLRDKWIINFLNLEVNRDSDFYLDRGRLRKSRISMEYPPLFRVAGLELWLVASDCGRSHFIKTGIVDDSWFFAIESR